MNIDDYQITAMRTFSGDVGGPDVKAMTALGLAGEAGEYADAIKKFLYHGHDMSYTDAREELGDVLWYLATAASCWGLSLSDVADANVAKLEARYPNGFDPDRSRNR